jgi:hypothetical protein
MAMVAEQLRRYGVAAVGLLTSVLMLFAGIRLATAPRVCIAVIRGCLVHDPNCVIPCSDHHSAGWGLLVGAGLLVAATLAVQVRLRRGRPLATSRP